MFLEPITHLLFSPIVCTCAFPKQVKECSLDFYLFFPLDMGVFIFLSRLTIIYRLIFLIVVIGITMLMYNTNSISSTSSKEIVNPQTILLVAKINKMLKSKHYKVGCWKKVCRNRMKGKKILVGF